MSDDDIPKIKKLKYIKLIPVFIIFVILVIIVISLIPGRDSDSSWLMSCFSPKTPEISFDELSLDIGRSKMFEYNDGVFAAVGTLGLRVLNANGREILGDSFSTRMINPAIRGSAGNFITFDIGGTAVRVFNSTQITSSLETDGVIVSASINQDGWFCIVTQEGGNTRGTVRIYDSSGVARYRVHKETGFILSAELSHDNNTFAILNYTEHSSRISFYHGVDTDKDEPDHIFDFTGGLIIDIMFLPNGDLLVFSTNSVFLVETSGEGKMLYSFHDKHLNAYTFDKDLIALHLYDYGVGHQGRLVTFDTDGTILGELAVDREVLSISAADKTLIVLKSDGIHFTVRTLKISQ